MKVHRQLLIATFVMPASLIIEGLAQTAGLLISAALTLGSMALLWILTRSQTVTPVTSDGRLAPSAD